MKKRSDSIHVRTEIMGKAVKKIKPPSFVSPLNDSEMQFFDDIASSKMEWPQIDIIHAVNLARCFAEMARLNNDLEKEGLIINGKVNPKHDLMEMLTRRSLALCRLLNIHAAATQGRARNQAVKNRAFREAQEAMDDLDDDGLITKSTEH